MKTVLIDPKVSEITNEILGMTSGIDVIGAYDNGEEGLKGALRLKPDVVFLNLDLPEVGGLKTLENLVKAGLRVIASSEWSTFAYDAERLGAIAYVMQPLDQEEIDAAFKNIKDAKPTKNGYAYDELSGKPSVNTPKSNQNSDGYLNSQPKNASPIRSTAKQNGQTFEHFSTSKKQSKTNETNSRSTKQKQATVQHTPKKGHYAFLIACQEYEKEIPLKNPINDATALGNLLREEYGFETHTLLNPRKDELIYFIDSIYGAIQDANSKVIIYYAGHSFITENEEGVAGHFVPVDGSQGTGGSCLPFEYLVNKLETLPATHTRHMLLLLDCCNAGIINGIYYKRRDGRNARTIGQEFTKQIYNIYEMNPSWQILVAAAVRQSARDSFRSRNGLGHSPFTYFLLEALEGNADPDGNKVIGADDLYVYIRNKMEIAYRTQKDAQRVGFIPMSRHEGGEFMFKMKGFSEDHLHVQEFNNPYKGLEPYSEYDKVPFCGRESETNRLVDHIINQAAKILIVKGPSGAGKSSIVKAGAVPVLETKFGKKVVFIKPSVDPILENPDCDIVIIDQYESVYDPKFSKDARKFFNQFILSQIEREKKVVLTLREDFESIAKNEELRSFWDSKEHFFELKDFSFSQITEIITAPTLRYGFDLHPISLADEIASEVFGNRHSLPMLSFMMHELCEKCKDSPDGFWRIEQKDYEAIGKVQGAIKTKADSVFESLKDPKKQDLMRNIMLRMVGFIRHDQEKMFKRAVYAYDLEYARTKFVPADVEMVLGELINNRLIVTGEDDHGSKYYEPAHQALIESWPRMHLWLQEAQMKNLEAFNDLNTRTHIYFDRKKRARDLPGGSVLNDLLKYAHSYPPITLNVREEEMLSKARGKRQRETLWFSTLLTLVAIVFAANFYSIWLSEIKKKLYAAERKEAQINGQIANLEKEVYATGLRIDIAKTLRKQENYFGELTELDNIDSLTVSNSMISVRYRLNSMLSDTMVAKRDSFYVRVYNCLNKIDIHQDEAKCERDSCLWYMSLWKRYTALKQAGDELRVQGDEKLLAAYRKFLSARAVGYPPRRSEINTEVRETGELLKRVYNQFMEYGDRRLKAGNRTAALEAYDYSKEIGVAMGLDLNAVNVKIKRVKGI